MAQKILFMKRCAKISQLLFCLAVTVWASRASAQTFQSGFLDNWTWRNPLPTANQLNGVCFGNSLFVACGEVGTVLTSLDATNWVLVPTGTTERLTAISFGKGLFICVSDHGSILTSADGTNWSQIPQVAATGLSSIAYGNRQFVAVGSPGTVMSSADGTNWTLQSSGRGQALNSITYAQGLFAAVGVNGGILTSPDAVTWTSRNAEPVDFTDFLAVGYGDGKFIALAPYAAGASQTSLDGTTWIDTPFNPGFGNAITCATNGLFIAVGAQGFFGSVMLSTNGTDWVNEGWLSEILQVLNGVCYAEGHFVAVGNAGTILVSVDGSNWTQQGADVHVLFGTNISELTAVTWGNKQFLASRSRSFQVGNIGSPGALLRSSDGITWSNVLSGSTPGLHSVCYGGGNFVTTGENGTLMTSSNGLGWTSITSGMSVTFYDASYANNVFVVVGQNGTVLTSTDTTTWINRTPAGVVGDLASVTYGNGIYLAVGNNGAGFATILASSDGTNWNNSIPANSFFPLSGVTFGNGLFVAVGITNGAGGILVSKDGAGWSQVLSQGQPLLSIIYAEGLFLAVGQWGTILSSPDGQSWTGHTVVTADPLNGIVEGNKQFIVVGGHDTILQGQPVAPVLPVQPDRIILGQTGLVVTNKALASDVYKLSYQLIAAPSGATIDNNGVIRWTPDVTQEPSTNVFTTVVTDNAVPPRSATNGFVVIALSYQPPVLTVPDTVTILDNQSFTLQVSANGAAPLIFTLGPGAPSGAALSQSGLFSWTPDESQAPSTNLVTVCVSDGSSTTCKLIQFIVTEDPLEILSPPLGGSFAIGSDVTLSVSADGATPVSYQWQFNGTNLAGATQSTLTLTNAQFAQSGLYSVTVSNQSDTLRTTPVSVQIGATQVSSAVVTWNNGLPDQRSNVPANLTNAIAIAAADAFDVALNADGTVVAWGAGSVPYYATNVVAIAAGSAHVLGLRADGNVATWGTMLPSYVAPPPNLTNAVAIDVGRENNLALRPDGTVVSWGFDSFDLQLPCVSPVGLNNVVAISAGRGWDLAIKSDGTVVAWDDGSGEFTVVPADLTNVVAVSCGDSGSLALKSDGTVEGWLARPPLDPNQLIGDMPSNLKKVVAISAKGDHGLALLADGTVVAWGTNNLNYVPAGLSGVVAINGAYNHCMALLRNGSPHVTVQPWDRSVFAGSAVTLHAKAVGMQSMNYQWRQNGADIPGATNESYNMPSAQLSNAGGYTLAVSNSVGVTLSREARLSVVAPVPPTLLQPTNFSVNAGQTVSFTNSAVEADPGLQLTFSLDQAPAGATVGSDTGVFTWRPPVSAAGTTNGIIIRVTDDNLPPLSDTRTFFVAVNPLQPASITPSLEGGQLHFVLSGTTGPDYILQASNDLKQWTDLQTNSPVLMPFDFAGPGLNLSSHRFFRVRLGP